MVRSEKKYNGFPTADLEIFVSYYGKILSHISFSFIVMVIRN